MEEIKLTQHSHGAGCGCKIAPAVLEQILKSSTQIPSEKLIVGNSTKDDAAVYEMDNGQYLISTTDFFTPIVDDAFDFGRIAAANAISDVYAMGGTPIMALAILGWPVNKLPVELAQKAIEGMRSICVEANIPLAGGHSIDSPEPILGLSVNGIVSPKNLKRNNTAQAGDLIYITKKLGVGILATAEKKGMLAEEHKGVAVKQMTQLNKFGAIAGALPFVHAMTDVTGFGLLGHLIEMAEGSDLSAEVNFSKVPLIANLNIYTSQGCLPDNTYRNWNGYENKVNGIGADSLYTLCDPQTNGGLLIAIDAKHQTMFEEEMKKYNLQEFMFPIAVIKPKGEYVIEIK